MFPFRVILNITVSENQGLIIKKEIWHDCFENPMEPIENFLRHKYAGAKAIHLKGLNFSEEIVNWVVWHLGNNCIDSLSLDQCNFRSETIKTVLFEKISNLKSISITKTLLSSMDIDLIVKILPADLKELKIVECLQTHNPITVSFEKFINLESIWLESFPVKSINFRDLVGHLITLESLQHVSLPKNSIINELDTILENITEKWNLVSINIEENKILTSSIQNIIKSLNPSVLRKIHIRQSIFSVGKILFRRLPSNLNDLSIGGYRLECHIENPGKEFSKDIFLMNNYRPENLSIVIKCSDLDRFNLMIGLDSLISLDLVVDGNYYPQLPSREWNSKNLKYLAVTSGEELNYFASQGNLLKNLQEIKINPGLYDFSMDSKSLLILQNFNSASIIYVNCFVKNAFQFLNDNSLSRFFTENIFNEFREEINIFSKLESFSIYFTEDYPTDYQENWKILSKYKNLKSLRLKYDNCVSGLSDIDCRLPSVRNLELRFATEEIDLRAFLNMMPNLKDLTVYSKYSVSLSGPTNWNLKSLRINVFRDRKLEFHDFLDICLRLPNLSTLTFNGQIMLQGKNVNLDFYNLYYSPIIIGLGLNNFDIKEDSFFIQFLKEESRIAGLKRKDPKRLIKYFESLLNDLELFRILRTTSLASMIKNPGARVNYFINSLISIKNGCCLEKIPIDRNQFSQLCSIYCLLTKKTITLQNVANETFLDNFPFDNSDYFFNKEEILTGIFQLLCPDFQDIYPCERKLLFLKELSLAGFIYYSRFSINIQKNILEVLVTIASKNDWQVYNIILEGSLSVNDFIGIFERIFFQKSNEFIDDILSRNLTILEEAIIKSFVIDFEVSYRIRPGRKVIVAKSLANIFNFDYLGFENKGLFLKRFERIFEFIMTLNDSVCSVCLDSISVDYFIEFDHQEMIHVLHLYHIGCINTYFYYSSICPLCRGE